ncbi:hypothetical protein REJC140_00093 [Pseudorhizobium endolithicum]|uniref:Holin n=1 Tax=Pseudorhizobium endolithicum TaxID=1191678 RepID=A0ABM8PCF3_9HYPH|nr:hypothetical protein [Pseudorhizobium endolithicum]CAD7023100.1 hypothetical protein REJC140_00093 [Pseudorhizobium endolithicum]
MTSFFKMLARWRTWIVNGLLALITVLPEILNAPEILAIVPQDYQRMFLAGLFLLNIWLRPRPAVLPSDPEVQIKKVVE